MAAIDAAHEAHRLSHGGLVDAVPVPPQPPGDRPPALGPPAEQLALVHGHAGADEVAGPNTLIGHMITHRVHIAIDAASVVHVSSFASACATSVMATCASSGRPVGSMPSKLQSDTSSTSAWNGHAASA